jgi:hypothetical protein
MDLELRGQEIPQQLRYKQSWRPLWRNSRHGAIFTNCFSIKISRVSASGLKEFYSTVIKA